MVRLDVLLQLDFRLVKHLFQLLPRIFGLQSALQLPLELQGDHRLRALQVDLLVLLHAAHQFVHRGAGQERESLEPVQGPGLLIDRLLLLFGAVRNCSVPVLGPQLLPLDLEPLLEHPVDRVEGPVQVVLVPQIQNVLVVRLLRESLAVLYLELLEAHSQVFDGLPQPRRIEVQVHFFQLLQGDQLPDVIPAASGLRGDGLCCCKRGCLGCGAFIFLECYKLGT